MTPNSEADSAVVRDNTEQHQYEITLDGRTSVLRYARRPGVISLMHTEVPAELRRRGLANTLAKTALDAARAAGEHVIPVCPFVKVYVERHPEYQALVAPPPGSSG